MRKNNYHGPTFERILYPTSGNVTLDTLHKVARIVGKEFKVELVWHA
jgi:hypothetical protein